MLVDELSVFARYMRPSSAHIDRAGQEETECGWGWRGCGAKLLSWVWAAGRLVWARMQTKTGWYQKGRTMNLLARLITSRPTQHSKSSGEAGGASKNNGQEGKSD